MVLVDGVQTLANTIIDNSIPINLVLLIVLSCEVVVTIVVEAKDDLYHDQYLLDQFLPLVIEVLRCLHR